MSQPRRSAPAVGENVALVERAYRRLQEVRDGKPGAIDEAFDTDFDAKLEVRIPGAYPEGAQTFRGKEGLQRWTDTTREVWEEWRFVPERFLEAGDDRVLVLIRVLARGGASGVSLDRETAHMWTIEHGRLTRCAVYLDRSEAIAAAGLQDRSQRHV